jgi:hypothetical protein
VGDVAFSGPPNPDRTGTTWRCDGPCPECGHETVIGYLLVNEHGDHAHTRYLCTFWRSGGPRPCGWQGWFVPGWDAVAEVGRVGRSPSASYESRATDR